MQSVRVATARRCASCLPACQAVGGPQCVPGGESPHLNPALHAHHEAVTPSHSQLKCRRPPARSGGGGGPLRRAPVHHLDMRGRPGLLRTTLEAQETRGLTRSDDLSRLLPSEVHWGVPACGMLM